MPITVEVFPDIAVLPRRFDPLFEAAGEASLFLSRDWFEVLASTGMDAGTQQQIYAATDENSAPLAVLPLMTRPTEARTARSLATYYSLLYSPLTARGLPEDEATDCFQEIARSLRQQDLTKIELAPVAPDCGTLMPLTQGFRREGFRVRTSASHTCWFANVAGVSAETFRTGRPSRLLNTLRRRIDERQFRHRFTLYASEPEIPEALRHYEHVYARSWKKPESFHGFIEALMRLCAASGAMRMGIWFIDDEPVAAQLWIVHNGRASIYKLAHDERFDGQSVGSALTLKMFEEILERDAPAVIDFGLGDEAYKRDWTPLAETRLTWTAFDARSVPSVWRLLCHDLKQVLLAWRGAAQKGHRDDRGDR